MAESIGPKERQLMTMRGANFARKAKSPAGPAHAALRQQIEKIKAAVEAVRQMRQKDETPRHKTKRRNARLKGKRPWEQEGISRAQWYRNKHYR
jgi:hypothetical protein